MGDQNQVNINSLTPYLVLQGRQYFEVPDKRSAQAGGVRRSELPQHHQKV
jgi:hypothetical protein